MAITLERVHPSGASAVLARAAQADAAHQHVGSDSAIQCSDLSWKLFRTWVATDLTMELQDRAVLEGRLELPADGPQAEASLRDDLAVIPSD